MQSIFWGIIVPLGLLFLDFNGMKIVSLFIHPIQTLYDFILWNIKEDRLEKIYILSI